MAKKQVTPRLFKTWLGILPVISEHLGPEAVGIGEVWIG